MPGNNVQRYLVSFTEPYLFSTPISLTTSGYLFDRSYYDWDENRVGGRLGLGYRLTPDLSVSASLRMEDVDISDPRVLGIPALDRYWAAMTCTARASRCAMTRAICRSCPRKAT